MDSADTPQPETPSTSIHRRRRHDHDDQDLDPVGPENPDMINKEEDTIQIIKLVMSIWSTYARFVSKWYTEDQELQIRLKHVDQVVQKIAQGNEEDMESAAPSPTKTKTGFSILQSLYEEMEEIEDLRDKSCDITSPSPSLSVFAGEVVSLMDSILQNLNDTFILLADVTIILHSNIPLDEEQVKGLKERLFFLRNFLWLIPNQFLINHQNYVIVFDTAQRNALEILPFLCLVVCVSIYEEVVWEVGDACSLVLACIDHVMGAIIDAYLESLLMTAVSDYDYDDEDDDENNPTMDEKALEFVDYIIHKLKLMMLSYNQAAAEDQFDILIDELSFLRCNLMEDLLLFNLKYPIIKEMKSLAICTRALVFKTGSFFCKSRDLKQEDERMVEYCSLKIPDLLRAVDDIKEKASDLVNRYFFSSRKSWQSSNCPSTTNVLEYVNFIINKLEQLLRSKADPLNALEPYMEHVYEQLVSMRKLLYDIAQHLGNSHMEFLLTRFKDSAYQAEYVIDSFVASEGSIWGHKLGLFVVLKDVKILHKELKAAILTMTANCDTVIPTTSSSGPSQANYYVKGGSKGKIHNKAEAADNKLVGFKDAEAEIIELLTGGSRPLKIVSIVGMPGLGKTTLANSVYNHPSINLHFHVHAWCCVSQTYEKDTLLLDMFDQIVGKTIQSHETTGEDFVQKLYQSLKGRKFLIVIDDIWDIKAWNDLKEPFPDDQNGSRILFTTRHQTLALEANSIPYALRLLSPEESCELLWLRLFDGETCPPELSTISKCIARNCKGLPLAVILIAGILKKTERKEDCWEHVSNKLFSLEASDILEFSYKHLPDCLRPCFLYFGTFPEDTIISASKLIQLWICEGFVQQPNLDNNSSEQEAENYLNDLVDRSLVMIARRSSKGGVKACRVHDVLRDFCSTKLQDERFLLQEQMFGGICVLHGDLELRIICLFYDYKSHEALNHRYGRIEYACILLYKFLRVLDLGNIRFGSYAATSDFVKIAMLVNLKYLAIRVFTDEIPSEIGNLQKLETFFITGAFNGVKLPETIWTLATLRHLLIKNYFFSFEHYGQDFFQNFSQLDNLNSISALPMRHGDDVEKFILRRLTGIQKLGCKFSNSWDDSTGCNLFPLLDFLSELESLKLLFFGKALYPCKFNFPSNLKKLSMSNFRLPWDEISYIGQLPNLEVLKLLNKAFEGQQWEMREGEFKKLKFLKLDSLNIEQWNASNEHLPRLEQLVVLNCQQLDEIPSSFGEIPTLQLIDMKWCSSSAAVSVQQILEGQRDMSNNQLNVNIVGVVESHSRTDP
ncbi:hypothetical protein ACH5RR_034505 [Cinchona calisaya]|uniref:Late blight resistance protein homolog R1A-3 n=1 Tax=Cinchona calisaya TaxID=153742 RepID=A0ABD2YEM1_9GENT